MISHNNPLWTPRRHSKLPTKSRESRGPLCVQCKTAWKHWYDYGHIFMNTLTHHAFYFTILVSQLLNIFVYLLWNTFVKTCILSPTFQCSRVLLICAFQLQADKNYRSNELIFSHISHASIYTQVLWNMIQTVPGELCLYRENLALATDQPSSKRYINEGAACLFCLFFMINV